MPLNSKQNAVDGWVAARFPAFQAKQDAWRLSHEEYFQGLVSHTTLPHGDANGNPDNLDSHPTDRPSDWNDFLTSTNPPVNFPASMPAAIIFNVYEGPLGWGWELVSEFTYGSPSLLYRKVWNTGPEDRDTPWQEIDPAAQP